MVSFGVLVRLALVVVPVTAEMLTGAEKKSVIRRIAKNDATRATAKPKKPVIRRRNAAQSPLMPYFFQKPSGSEIMSVDDDGKTHILASKTPFSAHRLEPVGEKLVEESARTQVWTVQKKRVVRQISKMHKSAVVRPSVGFR